MLIFRMSKIQFYIMNNNLYQLNYKNYLSYLKKNIFNQAWFKKACKEKKIKITYLSKNIVLNDSKNIFMKYEKNNFYFPKQFLLKFTYLELEENNHLKLLNINIRNETIFKVITLLCSLQKLFLKTNYYEHINRMDRKAFVNLYIERFNSYLDISILCKIFKNVEYLNNNSRYKLDYLIPRKSFLYSLFIKAIVSSDSYSLKGDSHISEILLLKYDIKISRRRICYIRNKYLIPKMQKKKIFNFYLFNEKRYDNKRLLNKYNISILENNTEGIYELSSNKMKKYSYSQNNTIYIGSSKNIKKRLSTYTHKTAHTKHIRNFFEKKEKIFFRIIRTINYKEFEMNFINAFIDIHGELPKLNKQRILNIEHFF